MKVKQYWTSKGPWLLLAMACFLYNTPSYAGRITLDVRVESVRGSDQPNRLSAHVSYALDRAKEHCFYVPYNDPRYHKDRHIMRSFDLMLRDDRSQPLLRRGHVAPRGEVANWQLEQKQPYLWRFHSPDQEGSPVVLQLAAEVPHPAFGDQDEWFFDGFYPVPLKTCPERFDDPRYFQRKSRLNFSGQIASPSGWTMIAPSASAPINTDHKPLHVFNFEGREFSFALMRGVQVASAQVSGYKLNFVYRNKDFLELKQTLTTSFATVSDWLGPPPSESLYLVETTDLQNPALPGIMTINRPRQAVMSTMQSQWLNWSHWAVVTSLTAQWFGASISVATPDDQWLLVGFRDFLTMITLEEQHKRFDFFGKMRGRQLVSLTYKELQEIQAALLERGAPHVFLTDNAHNSAVRIDRQNPTAYIRHSMLLRHMQAIAGSRALREIFRRMVQRFADEPISPAALYEFAASLPSPLDASTRANLQKAMNQWWQSSEWPDLALASWETNALSNGKYLTKIEIEYLSGITPPADVKVSDGRAISRIARAELTGAAETVATASILTDFEPTRVQVDPLHTVYDSNRFNNKSGWPSFSFFPGDAKGVAQDKYTVVWLPFPIKRPGEPFVMVLQAGVLRFIHSQTVVRIEYAPKPNQMAFNVSHRRQLAPGLDLSVQAGEDLRQRRLADASLARAHLFGYGPNISLGLSARMRELANVTESRHQTLAANLQVRPSTRNLRCPRSVGLEHEQAPKFGNNAFTYDRSTMNLQLACTLVSDVTTSFRAFRGKLVGSEQTPMGLGFYLDDLQEARIRYDFDDLAPRDDLYTLNFDIFFPLRLPFGRQTLMLSQRIRGRLFYDYGLGFTDQETYRAAGWGFMMPLGGDLVGVGELAFLQLSLLVASYASAGDETFDQPTILFDLSGEL